MLVQLQIADRLATLTRVRPLVRIVTDVKMVRLIVSATAL